MDDLNTELVHAKGNFDFIPLELRSVVSQVDDAFDKVSPTIKDVIYMRGEHYNPKNKARIQRFLQFKNAKKGDIIGLGGEPPGYPFFTDNLEYANHFASFKDHKKVVIKMCIPKGSNIPLNT